MIGPAGWRQGKVEELLSNSEGVRRLSLVAGLVPAIPLAAILLGVAFDRSYLGVGDIFATGYQQ